MLSREGKGGGVVTALLTTKKPITIWKKKREYSAKRGKSCHVRGEVSVRKQVKCGKHEKTWIWWQAGENMKLVGNVRELRDERLL